MTTLAEEFEDLVDTSGLRYFKGRELTPYWDRKRGKAKNSMPPRALWPNLIRVLQVADQLREEIGAPATILSSYRSPIYNKAVGGEKASYHMKGMALDLCFGKGTLKDWHKVAINLRGKPINGDVWFGGIGLYPKSGFIHIDIRGFQADWEE